MAFVDPKPIKKHSKIDHVLFKNLNLSQINSEALLNLILHLRHLLDWIYIKAKFLNIYYLDSLRREPMLTIGIKSRTKGALHIMVLAQCFLKWVPKQAALSPVVRNVTLWAYYWFRNSEGGAQRSVDDSGAVYDSYTTVPAYFFQVHLFNICLLVSTVSCSIITCKESCSSPATLYFRENS